MGRDGRRDGDGREARLGLVAGRQAGTFSFRQLVELGFPRSTIVSRLRRCVWEKRLPGVYAAPGVPRTREHELWVRLLAVGDAGVITHESAAICAGAERLAEPPYTLTVPHRWHHQISGTFVHQIDDLAPHHRGTWQGLPVSRPARAVVELAATQSADTVGRVLDDLLRLRRTSVAQVTSVFAQVARPGKPGMTNLAAVLEERSGGYVPPHSELERLLFDTLRAGGLPEPRRQVRLPGRGRIEGIADAGYDDVYVLLEADGRRWHDRLAAARRDRERDQQAARAGWLTLRFVHEQLVEEPAEVCAVVDDTRLSRAILMRRSG
jgi:very-short-patch-repair endonuclease